MYQRNILDFISSPSPSTAAAAAAAAAAAGGNMTSVVHNGN